MIVRASPRRLFLGWLVACCAGGLFFQAALANHEPAIEIQVASTFPTAMPILGSASLKLSQKIELMSAGRLLLVPFEPNTLVPAPETVNAVSDGRVSGAWAGAGWFARHDSAFNMFSSVPFGPDIGEYLAWMYHGGGLEMAREMFAEYNVYNTPCGMFPPEASGWFSKEITEIEDLRGLRMRFFGLGAQVIQRFGVETQQLAPGDILAELQAGRLDAAEFSLPAMDVNPGDKLDH